LNSKLGVRYARSLRRTLNADTEPPGANQG